MTTINGALLKTARGTDWDRDEEAGTYTYRLEVSGEGKLAFKVERRELTGNGSRWETIESKSKVRGGSTLSGAFTAAETLGGQVELRFNFNRDFFGRGVSYELEYSKS